MDLMLFTGFCTIVFLIFLYKALAVYRIYHHTFYEYLYSNFLEFYIKYKYKKNLSESGWLTQEIKTHRLLFNSYLDDLQVVQFQFITLFSQFGIDIFCIGKQRGSISKTSQKAKWKGDIGPTSYYFNHPELICKTHLDYINKIVGTKSLIRLSILFPDETKLENIDSNYSLAHYSDLLTIVTSHHSHLQENDIVDLFNTCINKR